MVTEKICDYCGKEPGMKIIINPNGVVDCDVPYSMWNVCNICDEIIKVQSELCFYQTHKRLCTNKNEIIITNKDITKIKAKLDKLIIKSGREYKLLNDVEK